MDVVAVIRPESEIAAAVTENGRVGVLATPATVRSRAYGRALASSQRALTVTEVEAPALAAVIQRGFPFDQSVVEMVRTYCAPLRQADVDTVVLGCTHYPLVAPMLQRTLGRDVRLVTAGMRSPARRSGCSPSAAWTRSDARRALTASSAPRTPTPFASSARASCRCPSGRSSGSS